MRMGAEYATCRMIYSIMGKRTIYRLLAIIAIIVIACCLYWQGKGHTILLDNKEISLNGTSYKAAGHVNVSVDGKKEILVKSGSRKKLKGAVSGPWHSITVEVLGEGNAVTKTIERNFSLSLDDIFLLSLPGLLAEDANWVQVFQPAAN